MNKQKINKLVPALRFPEFKNDDGWKKDTLGQLGEFKNGINFSTDKKGQGVLTVDVLNMYGEGILIKLDSLYRIDVDVKDYYLTDGDILFVRSSMKREGVGWVALFKEHSEPVLFCGFLIRLRLSSNKATNPLFLSYYLRSDTGRNRIISLSGTAAITNISQDSLKTLTVPLSSRLEQQKIADCLGSVDELIAAQTQKVDALKAHKKGLMQQLFPAEGKTVPALRFPEFRGKWVEEVLSPYIEQHSERVPSNTELDVYSSTRKGLKPQSDYYDGRKLLNDGEYGVVPNELFVYRHMSDDDTFKFNINKFGKKIAVSKEYPVFKTVNLASNFLLYLLNEGREFKRFAASQKKGGTRTRLYLKTLRSFEPFMPCIKEQKKIADCLSSLDELITTQTQKIDVLKAHEKGLMQQLFPAMDEVGA